MSISNLKLVKHSKVFGEVFWPGVGYIAINGADRVLGSVMYSGSERLRDKLQIDPQGVALDMDRVEAMAEHMFPGSDHWLWTIHGSIEDIFEDRSN